MECTLLTLDPRNDVKELSFNLETWQQAVDHALDEVP